MPVYNLAKAMLLLRRACVGLALLLVLAGAAVASSRWDARATELAHKIAAASGPANATMQVRNLSTLPEEQVAAIRHSLEVQLGAEGVHIRPEHDASVELRVTLSENRRGWLWIAEIQLGTESRITMLEVPAERMAASAPNQLPINLQSSLLVTTSEVLLDAQLLQTPQPALAALTAHSVVFYAQQGGRWQRTRELPIPLQSVMPLDPRGRLVPAADHPFSLYLPGGNCEARAGNDDAIALQCIASDDPWPLGGQGAFYNAGRNYFAGTLVPGVGHVLPPFYSAAKLSRANSETWIFAGIDDRTTSLDGQNELHLTGAASGWGSDIAALRSECGSGAQLLATQSGDDPASDSLQAFEIAGREPIAASPPLKFNGSITALWSAPGLDGTTVIVRTEGGEYDAYSITPACNR